MAKQAGKRKDQNPKASTNGKKSANVGKKTKNAAGKKLPRRESANISFDRSGHAVARNSKVQRDSRERTASKRGRGDQAEGGDEDEEEEGEEEDLPRGSRKLKKAPRLQVFDDENEDDDDEEDSDSGAAYDDQAGDDGDGDDDDEEEEESGDNDEEEFEDEVAGAGFDVHAPMREPQSQVQPVKPKNLRGKPIEGQRFTTSTPERVDLSSAKDKRRKPRQVLGDATNCQTSTPTGDLRDRSTSEAPTSEQSGWDQSVFGSKGRLKVTALPPEDRALWNRALHSLQSHLLRDDPWLEPGEKEDRVIGMSWKEGWNALVRDAKNNEVELERTSCPYLHPEVATALKQRAQNLRHEIVVVADTIVPQYFRELADAKLDPEVRKDWAVHLVNLQDSRYRFHYKRIAPPGKPGFKDPFQHPVLGAVVAAALFKGQKSYGNDPWIFEGTIPLQAFILCVCAIAHAIRRFHSGTKDTNLQFSVVDYAETHRNLERCFVDAEEKDKLPHGHDFLTAMYRNIKKTTGADKGIAAPRFVDECDEEEFED
ncbi:hypothetical protein P7C70_g5284, partial [Phenoliferia sp. Uapishka_3]